MPSPYRESDDTPPAPLAELGWRRRVIRSARWAELLVAGELALLLATQWLPASLALAGAVAWWVMGAALALATWLYTAPRPRARVGWRGWLLRASVPAYLGVTGLLLIGMHLAIASYVLGALLVVAGFAYALPFRRPRRPLRLRDWYLWWSLVAVYVTMLSYLGPTVHPFWRVFGVSFVLAAALGASALRRALLPVEVRWWFDNQTGTPGGWAALLVYRDRYAQVLFIDVRPRWFASKDDAAGWFASQDAAVLWLEDSGYLSAGRALAERLVGSVPPDTVPVARRRKRLRVEPSAPRVRVAADAAAEPALDDADAVDEPALDDAESPRAGAVRRPDE